MRTCPACGSPTAPTEDFCPNCGAYLNWSPPTPRNGAGTPGQNEPRNDPPRNDTTGAGTPQEPTPQAGTPQKDTHQGATPAADAPRQSTDRTGTAGNGTHQGATPRADAPQTGTPRQDTAQADTSQEATAHRATPPGGTPRQDTPGEATAPGGTAQDGTPEEATPQGTAPGAQGHLPRHGRTAQGGTPRQSTAPEATPPGGTPRQGMPGAAAPGGTHPGGATEAAAPQGRTAQEGVPHGGAAQDDAQGGTVPERDGSPASPPTTGVEPGAPAPAAANRWLSWLRRRPNPPAPAADRARSPEHAADPDPVADARTAGPAAGAGPVAPAPTADGGRGPEHTAGPQPVAPAPAADSGRGAERASGAGPVAPVHPAAASPAPVLPGVPVAPRPVVRPLAVSDNISGVPCPACGTPNPPDRRFCRRCAAPLTPSTIAAPLPWWRTVWPLRRRTRAGSGRLVRFLVVLTVVLALCAAGFLLLPAGQHLVQDTLDKLGKAKAVTPTRAQASAELPGHPVGLSTDGLSNRYWAAPGPGTSATYTFGKPFRLVAVIITNGASPAPEEYAKQGRALRIDMEVTDRDGATVHKQLVLSDKPGPQTFPTGISDVATVRLTLQEPAGSAPERPLALAEVEFFQRS